MGDPSSPVSITIGKKDSIIEYTEIKAVKNRHRARLLRLPNVTGVGVGPKTRSGQPTGETAIKVYVSKKIDLDDLAEENRIPSDIEGIPVDVEVLADPRAY